MFYRSYIFLFIDQKKYVKKSVDMNSIIGNVVTLIPLILIIYLLSFDKAYNNSKSAKHFLYALIITSIELVLDILVILHSGGITYEPYFCVIAKCISFTLAPFAIYNLLMLSIVNSPLEKHKNLFKIPVIINAIFSLTSIWTGLIYTVSANNEYIRGPLFVWQCVLHIVYLTIFFIYAFTKSNRYLMDDKVCFLVNFLVMVGAIGLQILDKSLCILWPTVSVSLIFYYIIHINHMLRRDTLTALFNRHMYERDLERFNGHRNVTIINIDVNDFKDINDSSGHHYGDEVLQKAALLLQSTFASYGYTYRIGGDEFCIILTKAMPMTIAEAFLSLEEQLIMEKQKVGITKLLSYGYCKYFYKGEKDIYQVVKEADQYMYKYKNRYKANLANLINL